MTSRWATCALCPRLCRSACPVVTGSGREAATPTWIATILFEFERGAASRAQAVEAATLCTDCGACQHHCHLDRPLPQALREARAQLLEAPPMDPLEPIEGTGELVAIEADARPVAAMLARHLGRPVRRWSTTDRLGVAACEHPSWEGRRSAIRAAVSGLPVVVADGGAAHALTVSGVAFRWLHDLIGRDPQALGSCETGDARPLACCGGAGPLPRIHPEDARRVGRLWLERADVDQLLDGRCRAHLRSCGGAVVDAVDHLARLLAAS